MYEYEVLGNKNLKKKKLLVVNSSYAAVQQCFAMAYPRGAILAPRLRCGEGIARCGLGLHRDVGSLHCGVGAR